MTRSIDVSVVVAAVILSLAGSVRPATGQIPDRTATPRLAIPERNALVLRVAQELTAPQEVTASSTADGVQVSWKPASEAAQYLVMRGPDGSTAGSRIGELPAGELTFLDRGFNQPAAYQIIAVAPDGRTAASGVALYTPPATIVTPLAPKPTTLAVSKTRLASVSGRRLPDAAPPVIETIGKNVRNGLFFYNGDTLQVTGSGFGGLSGVYLAQGDCNQYGCKINPHAGAPMAVTPLHLSAASFSFVPQVQAPYKNQLYPHFLIVTKGSAADTSDTKLDIGAARPVKKITSVKQIAVRSGLRFDVSGFGFDEVDGAYFGNGTPNSQNNLLYSIANRSSTSIQVMTTPTCDQRGILMLRESPTGQGTPALITGDTPIEVACVPGTPTGYLVNSPSMPNGNTYVMPGEKILILGTNLRYVTGVVDQRNVSHPFTYKPGFQSVPDQIHVSIPGVHPDRSVAFYGFRLENALTDPVVAGSVSGTAMVMAPPQWTSISRGWAEPGQSVQVTGSDLAFGQKPQVTVGGVSAEVTQFTQNYVTFRLGAATTSGPIRIEHQAGAVELTGPFTGGYPPKNHPGFFVVSGPSSVTEIVRPRPALATGDTLLVRGQNLVRLSGICLLSSGQGTAPAGYVPFMRTYGSGQEFEVTNTEMRVVFGHTPVSVAPGAVQLYERPSGSSQTVCTSNPAGIQWP